ncbi:MAG TPA: HlyD family efflux transporter periplasmic adaptor subunit [Gemmatimonadaceae bacterium]|nr:HlyD family efflux transporter periplasmic adaptor subunit [Gemmatimonadaceae bacterium]
MNRKRLIPIVVVLLVVATAVYITVFRDRVAAGDQLVSGTVEATEADLGFQVPGRIVSIGPQEGDRVTTGDTLALLDRAELTARRAQAEAALAAARAVLSELQRGARPEELAQARDADSTATARLADAQRDFDRTQRLYQGGAVPREAFDKASLALDVARGAKAQADQQLQLVVSGPRTERIAAQRAVVNQAQAAVRQADATMDNGIIRAPFDGVVTVRDREPGETVGAGMPVLTVMNLADRWVRIYVREDRIAAVRLGEPATISTDTYAGKTYPGAVSFISSEAEFTPRNVQTTEERVKLVYAVKVRITGDTTEDLKPGMPADVRLGGSRP